MAKFFNLKVLGPETEDALKTLGRLTQTKIEILQVITITVECDELAPIVDGMLQGALAKETPAEPQNQPATNLPAGIKSSLVEPGTGEKKSQGIYPRLCEACNQLYTPMRKDQRYCTRPECKQARFGKKQFESQPAQPKQEEPAASAPFKEPS